MANQPDEHKQSESRPPVFNDKATRDKIDKHLSDPHDTISEEDIRNIHTEPHEHYRVNQAETRDDEGNDEKITDKEEKEKKDEGGIETPWNILGD